MLQKNLDQIIREETVKVLEEGWKDVAMAGGMALGSLLPGQDAAAATPRAPAAQTQHAHVNEPLVLDSKWDMFVMADLFLDPNGGLTDLGQKELASMNEDPTGTGHLTDKAQMERKTLFKNWEAAPTQISVDDFIGAIMDPRRVDFPKPGSQN
tara:strand:- start:1693 stop:2151 length:459 start_codon:yes stop_codon:yes gene_type:complete